MNKYLAVLSDLDLIERQVPFGEDPSHSRKGLWSIRDPFFASRFGRWWGNDPEARAQTDIDVIAANPTNREILLGECKWKNELDVTRTVQTLRSREGLVAGYARSSFALFVKTDGIAHAARERRELDLLVRSTDEMFEEVL